MIEELPSLHSLIQESGLKTKKKFGQNFLLDPNITDKIARTAGSLEGKTVIEIGPGPGGLTRSLLRAGAQRVIAIETDPDCVALLSSLVEAAQGRLTLIHQDALTIDYASLIAPLTDGIPQTKIVANLPYNVGTPLLLKWLPHATSFESLTLMFQKEVALRLGAVPRTKDYGRLSVLTQWYMSSRLAFDVPPHAFTPPPKVTSSIVVLKPHQTPPYPVCPKMLEKVLKQTFGQRRKMLRVSLKGIIKELKGSREYSESDFASILEKVLLQAGIPPTKRPEELSLESFCRLSNALNQESSLL